MMTALNQQEIKILEQTRQRLFQLSNSLASLQHTILQSDPLPPWSSLQSLASIISQNLSSISSHLSSHGTLLASMAVFPLPSYPGKTQEALLNQLLRKKLEPEVEDWVVQGQQVAEEVGLLDDEAKSGVLDLWSWAGMAANELARGHEWGGDFTVEEREGGIENVVTGLRRKFKEEEDDDEDEEDREDGDSGGENRMEGVKAEKGVGLKMVAGDDIGSRAIISDPLPLEQVLRFMMTGLEPKT